jgi:hypothetical protein
MGIRLGPEEAGSLHRKYENVVKKASPCRKEA